MNEQTNLSYQEKEKTIFSDDFLMERPLLKSIMAAESQVLLIDEIDRADEEFESFFLELLSDWQITIPEALRRRCLYLWIDYPSFEKELEIIQSKLPNINEQLATQICRFMEEVRKMKLEKLPGIAETIDWAMALSSMHIDHLEKEVVESTLGVILKDWQDIRDAQMSLSELFAKVGVTSKMG